MIHHQFCKKYVPILFLLHFLQRCFLDDDETNNPTDLASFPTTKCCLCGDLSRRSCTWLSSESARIFALFACLSLAVNIHS